MRQLIHLGLQVGWAKCEGSGTRLATIAVHASLTQKLAVHAAELMDSKAAYVHGDNACAELLPCRYRMLFARGCCRTALKQAVTLALAKVHQLHAMSRRPCRCNALSAYGVFTTKQTCLLIVHVQHVSAHASRHTQLHHPLQGLGWCIKLLKVLTCEENRLGGSKGKAAERWQPPCGGQPLKIAAFMHKDTPNQGQQEKARGVHSMRMRVRLCAGFACSRSLKTSKAKYTPVNAHAHQLLTRGLPFWP